MRFFSRDAVDPSIFENVRFVRPSRPRVREAKFPTNNVPNLSRQWSKFLPETVIGGPAVGRLVEDVGPPPILPPALVPVPTPTPTRARVQVPFLRRLLESANGSVPDTPEDGGATGGAAGDVPADQGQAQNNQPEQGVEQQAQAGQSAQGTGQAEAVEQVNGFFSFWILKLNKITSLDKVASLVLGYFGC